MATTTSLVSVLGSLGVADAAALAEKIRTGSIKLQQVVETVGPPTEVEPRTKSTPPSVITEAQYEALERIYDVFGVVVPTERRALTSEEVKALYDERKTLDDIEAMATHRKENIRRAIVNHFDVELEEPPEMLSRAEGRRRLSQVESIPVDREGHYLRPAYVNVEEIDASFSWEVGGGSPVLSPERLKEMDKAGEIDHELYLRLTDQVRVVSEQKILTELANDPDTILDVLRRASVPGKQIGSLHLRKAKDA